MGLFLWDSNLSSFISLLLHKNILPASHTDLPELQGFMVGLEGLGKQVSRKAHMKAQHRLWCTMDVSEFCHSFTA